VQARRQIAVQTKVGFRQVIVPYDAWLLVWVPAAVTPLHIPGLVR
jgi:hypothetical protein